MVAQNITNLDIHINNHLIFSFDITWRQGRARGLPCSLRMNQTQTFDKMFQTKAEYSNNNFPKYLISSQLTNGNNGYCLSVDE